MGSEYWSCTRHWNLNACLFKWGEVTFCSQCSPGKCDERMWGICLFHVVVNQTEKYNNNQYYADKEERWLNGSAPDCKSNPAPPQHTENSVSPEVGSHLG
jgi:hypothetical protein